jgi:hypothetical protein
METTADTAAELGPGKTHSLVEGLSPEKTAGLASELGGGTTAELVGRTDGWVTIVKHSNKRFEEPSSD